MTAELRAVTTSGLTLYGFVLYGTFVYDATLGYIVEFDGSSWANYAISLSEIYTGVGIYLGDLPPETVSGTLLAIIYQRVGGTPAITDPVISHYEFEMGQWNRVARVDVLSGINDVSNTVSSLSVVDAMLIGWGDDLFPVGQKVSISGNDITVNFNLEDDNDVTYIGWVVWFKTTISGYPPTEITWLTTVVAQNGNVITVAAMPPQDLTYNVFKIYLFPPGWAAGGGGGATAEDVAAAILVTPANKIATAEGGAISTLSGHTPQTGDSYARLGAPAGASVSADIAAVKSDTAAILVDTDVTLPALISGLSGAIVTVVSSVDGGTITVYVGDTWRFTLLSEELTLDEYEVLGLVVKRSEKQADDDALLYLRTDDGLVRIGGAAPVDAGNGTLTKTANSFTTLVHLAETQELVAGSYLWWLKAFDSSVEPSEAKTLATGGFALKRGGLQAVE